LRRRSRLDPTSQAAATLATMAGHWTKSAHSPSCTDTA
jgi:hypothetical protein